jgi:AAA ATPase domain
MGSGSAFVGRAAELALLAEQAAAAGRGEGRAVLIGGEPGIGKTRLAGEAAACAAAAGMRWVRSRAVQDEGCPPYWMFGQVVRELAATHEPNESQRADLAVLSPGARPDASPPDALSDALAGRRFAVFESVREYLTDAAADTGLVLVLDDVHWADAPSLRLLRHLAAGLGAARLLLLITYRDTETGGRDELIALLAALAREEAVSRIRLTGLSQDEVAAQLAAVSGGAVAPEVAAAIGRRTHGNPFFVGELGRLHSASSKGASSDWSSPGSLPEAVRDTVRVRLHDLTPACREVLCAAAVLGADLDPAAVAAVTGREVGAVLAALDEAAAAGIVVAGPGWGFGHDLALAMAERLGDPRALRSALRARQLARGGPEGAPDRVELGARMLALGVADGDDEAVLWGRLWRADAFAQLGQVVDCSAEIALLEPVVARLRSPGPTWHLRRSELALAYGRGEFGRARRLAVESMRLAAHGHENMRTLTSAVIVRLNVMTGLDEWPADEDFSWSPPLGLAMRALWESAMGRAGEAPALPAR